MTIASTADALARARLLAPALRERAARCDTLRQLPAETIEALRDSGLTRIMVPRRLGGAALGFSALVATGAELAASCGSSGWVFCVFAGHNWLAALFPEEAQREVLAEPRALTAPCSAIPPM